MHSVTAAVAEATACQQLLVDVLHHEVRVLLLFDAGVESAICPNTVCTISLTGCPHTD